MLQFTLQIEQWPLARPFTIVRETIDHLPLVRLRITADGGTGQAEAAGVDYHGETVEGIAAQVEAYLGRHNRPPTRDALLAELAPGGARNAIDCALWDWEAKVGNRSAAEMAGIATLECLSTVYTLSLDTPERMADAAKHALPQAVLKLKIGARDGLDLARVAGVRAALPSRRLIVDVNEGWSRRDLDTHVQELSTLGVELIEQPLPARDDALIADYEGPVPLCADESVNVADDLSRLGAYGFINIKLDKSGGLTAALELADAARSSGKRLMVGSMLGTSLGMAPAFLVGQRCDYVDLDGPLLLASDRSRGMRFSGATVYPPDRALWG